MYSEEIKKCLLSNNPEIVASAINIIDIECRRNKEIFSSLLDTLIQI